jgi:hypothetical protein
MDKAEEELRSKFGVQELAEARELQRQMLKNADPRNISNASPDMPEKPNAKR